MVELLLAHPRVDPSAQSDEAIRRATEGGFVQTVRLLLTDGRVDPSSNNLVFVSAARGHAEIVELLLSHPPNASAQIDEAKTRAKQAEVVQVLDNHKGTKSGFWKSIP